MRFPKHAPYDAFRCESGRSQKAVNRQPHFWSMPQSTVSLNLQRKIRFVKGGTSWGWGEGRKRKSDRLLPYGFLEAYLCRFQKLIFLDVCSEITIWPSSPVESCPSSPAFFENLQTLHLKCSLFNADHAPPAQEAAYRVWYRLRMGCCVFTCFGASVLCIYPPRVLLRLRPKLHILSIS